MIMALFRRVEWEPIAHNAAINIDEIESETQTEEKEEQNV
jgi:hypothetical protein